MKNRIVLAAAFAVLVFALTSCSSGGNSSNTATTATTSNSNTTSSTKTSAKPQPKDPIKSEKKPEGQQAKALPSDKKVPVPTNWEYYADPVKGYGFWLPQGSVGDSSRVGDTDAFVAQTPAPSDVRVEVYAWKDKTLTKQDLVNMTVSDMKDEGETVTAGNLVGESDDYAVVEASSVDSDGKKYKMKMLVGTDVTDNYVMVVYTDADKYDANKDIIDAIWGNFEMYSGGASGNN